MDFLVDLCVKLREIFQARVPAKRHWRLWATIPLAKLALPTVSARRRLRLQVRASPN